MDVSHWSDVSGETPFEWLQDALSTLGLVDALLDQAAAAIVSERVQQAFVNGDPRVWCLDLARITSSYSTARIAITDIAPTNAEEVYLIIEPDYGKLAICSVILTLVPSIIGEMPGVEYHVLPKDLSWMISETEHDMLIASRPKDT
ncbi:MAG: hypothetical protein AAF577_07490 [Pseudomonadota bacterium]